MNKECISVLTYLTAFVLFLPKRFVDEVILIETNRIIKGPDIDFGEFFPVNWYLDVNDRKPWHKLDGVF